MATPKKPITKDQLRDWSSRAQLLFLEAVMQCGAWKPQELAFHGGTSLHMSWASPRFSEDLDFLVDVSRAQQMPKIMQAIERRLKDQFLKDDPAFQVEIRNKTKNDARMGNYHIVVSNPGILGSAMVKAEFWMVDSDYLKNYPTTFRLPMIPGEVVTKVSTPIPAAELTSAYADKLTAFATRPHLKWRDLFDLWWLGTQVRAVPDASDPAIIKQFLHNLSGYNTVDGMMPKDALARFHNHKFEDLVKAASSDLKRWLPGKYWETLGESGVAEIINYVNTALKTVEDALDAGALTQPQATQTASHSTRRHP